MFEQSHLVVDLQHLGLIEQWLENNAVTVAGVAEQNNALGLALLGPFLNLGEAIRRRPTRGPIPTLTDEERDSGAFDVEVLVHDIRHDFGSRFHGWTPIVAADADVATFGPEGGSKHPMGGSKHPMSLEPIDGSRQDAVALPELIEAPDDGVRVVVVDTHVYNHPRLRGRVAEPSPLPEPDAAGWETWKAHGTFVADVIAQQAPGARMVIEPVFGAMETVTSWALATRLVGLAGKGDIVNLSLGRPLDEGEEPPIWMVRALQHLSRSAVVVAAGGNVEPKVSDDEKHRPFSPASLPDVIAVGSDDEATSPRVPWLGFIARGAGVTAAYVDPQREGDERYTFATWSGTSFAAAAFSGRLAARSQGSAAHHALAQLQDGVQTNALVQRFVWGR